MRAPSSCSFLGGVRSALECVPLPWGHLVSGDDGHQSLGRPQGPNRLFYSCGMAELAAHWQCHYFIAEEKVGGLARAAGSLAWATGPGLPGGLVATAL